ncbi:MAG: response regulator [Rhodocyclaceae bacterium]|jgi:diguanylate cyclase (GGDEF)-like protein|nr:response regulator [Rhodocyclaceae bacterium]MCL4758609.1 response regulator [Rhodocyclaceae bacterium]
MSEQDPQSTGKILVVDDSRMVRASLIKHIRGRFEFREESDGEAAWQALVVDPSIDIVLTDIGMPQLDGYGLLDRIRKSRLARLQNLPVIIISGEEDDQARERARELGANDFVTKGIGTTELVARLDSLIRLGKTGRQLEESREALAARSVVDPVSGLPTPSYFKQHAAQELALARRHQGAVSVMVLEIDGFESFAAKYGSNVAGALARKLSGMLATKVRQEDTVAELAPGQFSVLSPVTDAIGCCAFALRMQKLIEQLVMTYRGETIRISVTVGISSSSIDGMHSVSHLIGIAIQRVGQGRQAGGNCVYSDRGRVTQEMIDRLVRKPVNIDQMLGRLRQGQVEEVAGQLPDIIATLLPLLELVESRLHCGIPVQQLKQHQGPQETTDGATNQD